MSNVGPSSSSNTNPVALYGVFDQNGNMLYGVGPAGTTIVWAGAEAGTTTNDNAAAGQTGEVITATLASASATALSTTVSKNITSISLTPGDWDVTGTAVLILAAATVTDWSAGASSTTGTLGTLDTVNDQPVALTTHTDNYTIPIPTVRFSLAATTTVYLVANATFSAGGITAWGTIRARRMR